MDLTDTFLKDTSQDRTTLIGPSGVAYDFPEIFSASQNNELYQP